MRLILRIMQTLLKYHISFEIKKKRKPFTSTPFPFWFSIAWEIADCPERSSPLRLLYWYAHEMCLPHTPILIT